MWHSAIIRGDVSDLLRNFLYENTCRKMHTQFLCNFFYFLFLKFFFLTILEDEGFKTAPGKKN